jgi:hypothetical protein
VVLLKIEYQSIYLYALISSLRSTTLSLIAMIAAFIQETKNFVSVSEKKHSFPFATKDRTKKLSSNKDETMKQEGEYYGIPLDDRENKCNE